jgi:hypothetical protein
MKYNTIPSSGRKPFTGQKKTLWWKIQNYFVWFMSIIIAGLIFLGLCILSVLPILIVLWFVWLLFGK